MRITKVLFFLIFLIGCFNLMAQTNFLKGYYITIKKDTIQGYIDYRSEKRNYQICVFKEDFNDKLRKKLYPQDIVGFSVDNKDFYEKHSFKSKKGEELYGFFKVIVRGNLSLLRYQSRYFAKNLNGEVFEISKRSEILNGKVKEDYYGLGMLKVLMKDCDQISEEFLRKEYKSNPDFTRIFLRYNSCIGSIAYKSEKIVIKPHLDLGFQISPTLSKLNLSSPLESASFDSKLSFGLGGFASIFLPKVDENMRIQFEINYSKYSQYGYFVTDNTNNDLFVDYSYLEVPLFIRYNINRLFIDIGIQNQFILTQDMRWRVETVQQNNVYTSEGKIAPFNSFLNGYLVGFGVRYKLSNYTIRSSIRFSQTKASNDRNNPTFQPGELVFSIQLK